MKTLSTMWCHLRGPIFSLIVSVALALLGVYMMKTHQNGPTLIFLGAALCMTMAMYTMSAIAIPKIISYYADDPIAQLYYRFQRVLGWFLFTLCVFMDGVLVWAIFTGR